MYLHLFKLRIVSISPKLFCGDQVRNQGSSFHLYSSSRSIKNDFILAKRLTASRLPRRDWLGEQRVSVWELPRDEYSDWRRREIAESWQQQEGSAQAQFWGPWNVSWKWECERTCGAVEEAARPPWLPAPPRLSPYRRTHCHALPPSLPLRWLTLKTCFLIRVRI